MPERKKPLLIQAVVVDEDGHEQQITVNAQDLHATGKLHHEQLTQEQTERATALYARVGQYLRGAYPTETQFIDQLRKERNPTGEIEAYECIYARLAWAIERFGATTPEQQQALFRALLLLSIGAVDVSSQTGIPDEIVEQLRVGPNSA